MRQFATETQTLVGMSIAAICGPERRGKRAGGDFKTKREENRGRWSSVLYHVLSHCLHTEVVLDLSQIHDVGSVYSSNLQDVTYLLSLSKSSKFLPGSSNRADTRMTCGYVSIKAWPHGGAHCDAERCVKTRTYERISRML